jgi:outer membrane protein assembly factor BamB
VVEDSIPPEYLPRPDVGASRPRSGPRIRPGRLGFGLLVSVLLGMAITLQVQAWRAVAVEAGGRCGTSYGSCPAGSTPVLITSFLALFVLIPAFFVLVVGLLGRRGAPGKVLALLAVLALIAGIFPGNAIWDWAHGGATRSLAVAWQLPKQTNPQLTAEGSWAVGGTIVRAEIDGLAAYDVASGHDVWSYEVPDPQQLCGMSRDTSQNIGVIAYGDEGSACNTLVAVDLGSGRQLWQQQLAGGGLPASATANFIAVVNDVVAVAATPDPDQNNGLEAFDLHTGASRWQATLPTMCSTHALGGGLTAVVLCVDPDTSRLSYSIQGFDPETGKTDWATALTYRGRNASVTPLSFAPLVVEVRESSARGTDQLVSLDGHGHVLATLDITNVGLNLSSGDFQADPVLPAAIGDGMLVVQARPTGSNARLVGYSLTTGAQVWSQSTNNRELQSLTIDNGRVVTLTQASFREFLTGYDLRTGATVNLGASGVDLLTAGTALHVVHGKYVVVDSDGNAYPPIVVFE